MGRRWGWGSLQWLSPMLGDSTLTPGLPCNTGRKEPGLLLYLPRSGQLLGTRALGSSSSVQGHGTVLQHGTFPLTSFSPQILLIIELEAGLEEGPRTPTTPFGRIWHTVGTRKRKHALDVILFSSRQSCLQYLLHLTKDMVSCPSHNILPAIYVPPKSLYSL